jgi:hypothetical protein
VDDLREASAALPRRAVSVREAAAMLSVGEDLLAEEIRAQRFPVLRIGRRIIVPVDTIERLLADAAAPRLVRPDIAPLVAAVEELCQEVRRLAERP